MHFVDNFSKRSKNEIATATSRLAMTNFVNGNNNQGVEMINIKPINKFVRKLLMYWCVFAQKMPETTTRFRSKADMFFFN